MKNKNSYAAILLKELTDNLEAADRLELETCLSNKDTKIIAENLDIDTCLYETIKRYIPGIQKELKGYSKVYLLFKGMVSLEDVSRTSKCFEEALGKDGDCVFVGIYEKKKNDHCDMLAVLTQKSEGEE